MAFVQTKNSSWLRVLRRRRQQDRREYPIDCKNNRISTGGEDNNHYHVLSWTWQKEEIQDFPASFSYKMPTVNLCMFSYAWFAICRLKSLALFFFISAADQGFIYVNYNNNRTQQLCWTMYSNNRVQAVYAGEFHQDHFYFLPLIYWTGPCSLLLYYLVQMSCSPFQYQPVISRRSRRNQACIVWYPKDNKLSLLYP